MSQIIKLSALLALFALAGCASQDIPDPDPQDSSTVGSSGSGGLSDEEYGAGPGGSALPEEDYGSSELAMVIYFEFDSSEIQPQYVDAIQGHARKLSNDSLYEIRLEGHTDERGSREYNIGLGERRAQAVRRMLLLQGAGADQISTVSFGEERPAASGSNESAWAQNRRVEIVYLVE
ncbi:MAG: peptidoglycan-associated lipoprotein Pal [Woeseiaceae bacterium]|nr:peptidoglycan-associated lipoprotein Pal [Woeseiaceae bacterium]